MNSETITDHAPAEGARHGQLAGVLVVPREDGLVQVAHRAILRGRRSGTVNRGRALVSVAPMPSLTRGPLPARVYWRRRMLLLALATLLVVGIARLLGSGSDASSDPEARPAAATASIGGSGAPSSPPVSTDGTIEATPDQTPSPGKHHTSQAPVLAEPDGACEATTSW